MGELLISTEKLNRILDIGAGFVRVEAGVPIAAMQDALLATGAWFPPTPTFTGAFAGGIVATNAAGAAKLRPGVGGRRGGALAFVLADGSGLQPPPGEGKTRA